MEGSSQENPHSREGAPPKKMGSVWAVQMSQCVDSSPVLVVQLVEEGAPPPLQFV